MATRWREEGEAFLELLRTNGYSQKRFAEKLGVSDDIVNNIVKGVTRLTADRLLKSASILGISDRELQDTLSAKRRQRDAAQERQNKIGPGEYMKEDPSQTAGKDLSIFRSPYRMVPIFGSVPAGPPRMNSSDAIEYIEMAEWGGDFDRWGRVITGDSMQPEFKPGDVVIFETRQIADNYAVYAWKEGEDTFKVLRDNMTTLCPMNPDPRFESYSSEGWEVMGIAIQKRRRNEHGGWDIREFPYGFHWPESKL